MTRCRASIAVLLLALVTSNLWWAYRLLDAGITNTYATASIESTSEALNQALAILPVALRPKATREEVINAARIRNDMAEPFEKEGHVWVGQLGLKFDERGRLIKAATSATFDER
jgi:hypothetical protein